MTLRYFRIKKTSSDLRLIILAGWIQISVLINATHDDVINWEHFPRYWPFVRGTHRSSVNSPQRPVTRSFDVFFDLSKQLSIQWWGWWFETLSRPLWRHRNEKYKLVFMISHHCGSCWLITECQRSGGWFNIKKPSYQYRKSHCGDKTVVRSSYLHNGISYTGKMTSLYWIWALLYSLTYIETDSERVDHKPKIC